MRAFIAFLMTGILILSSCGGQAAAELEPTQSGGGSIHYDVTTTVCEDRVIAESGEMLASYRFVLPVLEVHREDGAAVEDPSSSAERRAVETADVFNEKFRTWVEEEQLSELVAAAEEDLAYAKSEGLGWGNPYVLELDCTVYQTHRMLSVSGLCYRDTGGVHPNTSMLSWNFDLEEGRFLDPGLLVDNAELREAVADEIIRQAGQEQAPERRLEGYWEDYESIIGNWPSYAVTFNEKGMTVKFSPYELASYAAGSQVFEIPYDFLEPYWGDYMRHLLGIDEK